MVSQYFRGWRSGLARATIATAVVTIINIVFLAVAVPRMKRIQDSSGEGTLLSGDCKKGKELSIWLHLGINILGTILLAAGNYTQQILTAPTRDEIDAAHAKLQWMDIGVSSIRNLGKISRKRSAACAILGLITFPLHLLYNSTVSFESSFHEYSVYASTYDKLTSSENHFNDPDLRALAQSLDDLERLENRECVSIYGQSQATGRSDVILVVDSFRYINRLCSVSAQGINSDLASCSKYFHAPNPSNWTFKMEEWSSDALRPEVSYCLSKPVPEKCKLILNVSMLGIVVGFNLLKLVGLTVTWLALKKQSLLTLGEVMASFLDSPDPVTRDMSLLSKHTGKALVWRPWPRRWFPERNRWVSSVCRLRLLSTIGLLIFMLLISAVLLVTGVNKIAYRTSRPNFVELWRRGFGAVNFDSLISFDARGSYKYGAAGMALIANSPQLILSLIYASVNGLWTSMLVGVEWNSYGTNRKGLRTTSPVGCQRKTYFLSLPLRYGIPLLVASATLHWLISQSIFLARVKIYKDDAAVEGGNITTCGFSPIGIIFSLILGATIVSVTLGATLWPTTPAIPPGGICSAVVSAACHPPKEDEAASLELVQWGVLPTDKAKEWAGPHCCVTSFDVDKPERGKKYQ